MIRRFAAENLHWIALAVVTAGLISTVLADRATKRALAEERIELLELRILTHRAEALGWKLEHAP